MAVSAGPHEPCTAMMRGNPLRMSSPMPNRVAPQISEPSSTVALRRRAEAVTWVRLQIARYGLSYADLAAAGVFPSRQRQQKRLKVRYRSADGQTWDGEGEMPDWLKRAVNAGQSPEHFRVDT